MQFERDRSLRSPPLNCDISFKEKPWTQSKKINEWPVIIQGALGSFLFWFVLFLGQKAVNAISNKLGEEKETAIYFAKAFFASKPNSPTNQYAFANSMYGAFHYFVKSVLVILLSVLSGFIIPVFEIIGLLIACYFLFRALSYVPHFDAFGTHKKARADLGWDNDDKKANKSVKQTG